MTQQVRPIQSIASSQVSHAAQISEPEQPRITSSPERHNSRWIARLAAGVFLLASGGVAWIVMRSNLNLPPTSSYSQPITPLDGEGNNTMPKPTRSSSNTAVAGCVLTISNHLVALKWEPDRFSQELIRLKPGEYTSLDYRTISDVIKQEGWFQVEAEGRRDWIVNDT